MKMILRFFIPGLSIFLASSLFAETWVCVPHFSSEESSFNIQIQKIKAGENCPAQQTRMQFKKLKGNILIFESSLENTAPKLNEEPKAPFSYSPL